MRSIRYAATACLFAVTPACVAPDPHAQPVTDMTNDAVAQLAPQDDPEWTDTVSVDERLGEKMIGGSVTRPGDWPFIAVLRGNKSNGSLAHFCGGTVISAYWVLTAAHCVDRFKREGASWADPDYGPVSVVLGTRSLPDTTDAAVFSISDVVMHKDYVPADKTKGVAAKNDIALLKLGSRWTGPVARLSANASSDNDRAFGRGFVAGYGVTRPGGILYPFKYTQTGLAGEAGSAQLLHAILPMLSPQSCGTTLSNVGFQPGTQICAGFETGGIDSCQGDSGGPMAGLNDENKVYQIGIVSYGVRCAGANSPGVYTRVSAFAGWIKTRVHDANFVNARPETAITVSQETLKALVQVLARTPQRLSISVTPSASLIHGHAAQFHIKSEVAGRIWVLNIGPDGWVDPLYPSANVDPATLLVEAGDTLVLPGRLQKMTALLHDPATQMENNQVVAFVLPPSIAIIGDGIPALSRDATKTKQVDYGLRLRNQITRAIRERAGDTWSSGQAAYTISRPG